MADDDGSIQGMRFAKVVVYIVYAFFVAALVILVLAFFLLLFDASTSAEFTRWVYRSTNRVLEPFRGIFPRVEGGDGSVVDFAIVFAIIMYGMFALGVHALANWIDRRIVQHRRELEKAEWEFRQQADWEARQRAEWENQRRADWEASQRVAHEQGNAAPGAQQPGTQQQGASQAGQQPPSGQPPQQ